MGNFRKIILWPVILACCGCAHAPARNQVSQPEIIISEGLAGFNVKDLAASRTAAVLDAQKNALRRAAELFMDDVSRAENFAALESGPLKNPQNYLVKHKIMSEGAEGASYRVTLRTWVLVGKIAADIRGLSLSGGQEGRLRTALVSRENPEGAAFAAAFSDALSRRSLLEIGNFPFTKDKSVNGSDDALLAASSASGADVLITAAASAYASGAGLNTGFYPSRADASVKIYEVRSGKLLLELSRQGSAIDSSQGASFAKALATAGELLAQETAVKADRLFKTDAVIRIRVSGLDGLDSLEKLKNQLFSLGLKKMRLDKYFSGEAVFLAVTPRSDPQELASAILRADTMGLELEGASPQELLFTAAR